MTYDFNNHLNWKLLSGSHEFPGPAGGTCVNEAALVAAGFEYKSVRSADSMPECFSRVISAFAMMLNDNLDDDTRQNLIQFVTRMSGTADTPEVEHSRKQAINTTLVAGIKQVMAQVPADHMLQTFFEPLKLDTKLKPNYVQSLYKELLSLIYFFPTTETIYGNIRAEVIKIGFDALEATFAIGNKSSELDTGLVVARLEKAKQQEYAPVE